MRIGKRQRRKPVSWGSPARRWHIGGEDKNPQIDIFWGFRRCFMRCFEKTESERKKRLMTRIGTGAGYVDLRVWVAVNGGLYVSGTRVDESRLRGLQTDWLETETPHRTPLWCWCLDFDCFVSSQKNHGMTNFKKGNQTKTKEHYCVFCPTPQPQHLNSFQAR